MWRMIRFVAFQPFLRFYMSHILGTYTKLKEAIVSTLLEILRRGGSHGRVEEEG